MTQPSNESETSKTPGTPRPQIEDLEKLIKDEFFIEPKSLVVLHLGAGEVLTGEQVARANKAAVLDSRAIWIKNPHQILTFRVPMSPGLMVLETVLAEFDRFTIEAFGDDHLIQVVPVAAYRVVDLPKKSKENIYALFYQLSKDRKEPLPDSQKPSMLVGPPLRPLVPTGARSPFKKGR